MDTEKERCYLGSKIEDPRQFGVVKSRHKGCDY